MSMTEQDDDRDIPPDNGKRPKFATPIDERLNDVGTGSGYSGQEYDSAGQAEWRAEQERKSLPPGSGVSGSGIGAGGGQAGEDYDPDTPGGAEPDGQPSDQSGGSRADR